MGAVINKETFNGKPPSVHEKYVNPGLESKTHMPRYPRYFLFKKLKVLSPQECLNYSPFQEQLQWR